MITWTKRWNKFRGYYEHYSDDGHIALFRDDEGYKYRFIGSVSTQHGHGYATSIHHFKTLRGVQLYCNKNLHYMCVKTSDDDVDYYEYKINNDKIERVEK